MANTFEASTSQSAACTSSPKECCYDVFINHYGKDVKRTLASTIYEMLGLMKVKVFLDKPELEQGDIFPLAIDRAIRSASVHIAIFSSNYAKSHWCLDELALMYEQCLKSPLEVTIIPVFYGVDASDVRHVNPPSHEGHVKGKYVDALVEHEKNGKYNEDRIKKWKDALQGVADVTGFVVENPLECDLGELSRKIMESAIQKMRKQPSKQQMDVAKFPVALDEAVQDFERTFASSTGSEKVHIVGIYGQGGSGKTTLAKKLFNKKCSSISRSSFLYDVRDAALTKTLPSLQKNLLTDLHIKHLEFHSIDQGKKILAKGLSSMKVLIVLDNVDDANQIDKLVPQRDDLAPGSFIIVTTRDQEVLTESGISSNYGMKLLNKSKAKELFCGHAFLSSHLKLGFEDLIEKFVGFCCGLPLSLEVLGAMLKNKSKTYWEIKLCKISEKLPPQIMDCLRVSYEALDCEEKQMFLDIACFFVGVEKSIVIAIWDGSGWSGDDGLETLVNKCLVTINDMGCIEMHDHLRDLGRSCANSPENALPSLIWKVDQISNQRRTKIRGIVIDEIMDQSTLKHCMKHIKRSRSELKLLSLSLRGNDFGELPLSTNLVWLRLHGLDGNNLPSWVSLGELRVLELYDCKNWRELWKDEGQLPLQLRVLIIRVHTCTSFPAIPRSIGYLKHLKKIVFKGRMAKEFFHLEWLALCGSKLTALPDSFGDLSNLQTMQPTMLTLPDTFDNLTNLQTLEVDGRAVVEGNLTVVQTLQVDGRAVVEGNLTGVQTLRVDGSAVVEGNLTGVQTLRVAGSAVVEGNLTGVQTLRVAGSAVLEGNLTGVQTLRVDGSAVLEGNLTGVQTLQVDGSAVVERNLTGVTLRVDGRALVKGNLTGVQTLRVDGRALVKGNLTGVQTLRVDGRALVKWNLTSVQTLTVDGRALVKGNLTSLPRLEVEWERESCC